jgi:tetraacyldisaccharide 4'-kinase
MARSRWRPAGATPGRCREPAARRSADPAFSPWQRLYGGAHRLRRAWYRRRAERLPRPVISIGNLHWGGAGKTPLVAAVAAHLRDGGHRVCVLSRGYGRQGSGIVVVSTGEGPLVGPRLAGDEPVLLAGELPGVAVVVGRRRAAAGWAALERLPEPPEIFVLDDGFSHLALARDLDVLAFPAADPFAGGRLAPAGRLREPLAAAARADAAVLTGLEGDDDGDAAGGGAGGRGGEGGGRPWGIGEAAACEQADAGAALAAALAPHGFRGPGFASRLVAAPPRYAPGRPLPAGHRVLLVAGIARPERFFATARRLAAGSEAGAAGSEGCAAGFEVAGELAFPDHHDYPESSLEAIRRAAAEAGASALLVTTKDRVKLHGRLELALAELPVAAQPEAAFWQWLDGRLGEILPAAAGGGSGDRLSRGRR